MAFLHLVGITTKGGFREFSIGSTDIESCCELLSCLVKGGCRLVSVRLSLGTGKDTFLPVEAFDGQPMQEAMESLQKQWEEILYQH